MKVLVTGHAGYLGTILVPLVQASGHDVIGLDTHLFQGCNFGPPHPEIPQIRADIRDVSTLPRDVDVVVHLAGISNDPLGDLDPRTTYEINHTATIDIARAAKRAGVRRFVFASSCSVYGAQPDRTMDETSATRPVTPYGRSKLLAERDLLVLADDDFTPVILRSATAYGASPQLRGDLVVNNLVGHAVTEGKVQLKSDGMAWRPLVHVSDIARGFLAAVEAPAESVCGAILNLGSSGENFLVRDIAKAIACQVQGSEVTMLKNAAHDQRDYRVSFGRIAEVLPAFRPRWTLQMGITELSKAYLANGLTVEDLNGTRYQRIKRVAALQGSGVLSQTLRFVQPTGDTPCDSAMSAGPAVMGH